MEKQNLRAYFFQNMYLHGLHAGIQSQHTTAEMFIKYCEDCRPYEYLRQEDILCEWAREHKTTIVLNGALTNVGVILPERVYTFDRLVKESKEYLIEWGSLKTLPELTEYEMKIVEALRGKRLMS